MFFFGGLWACVCVCVDKRVECVVSRVKQIKTALFKCLPLFSPALLRTDPLDLLGPHKHAAVFGALEISDAVDRAVVLASRLVQLNTAPHTIRKLGSDKGLR